MIALRKAPIAIRVVFSNQGKQRGERLGIGVQEQIDEEARLVGGVVNQHLGCKRRSTSGRPVSR